MPDYLAMETIADRASELPVVQDAELLEAADADDPLLAALADPSAPLNVITRTCQLTRLCLNGL
jgi:hypothetical protein